MLLIAGIVGVIALAAMFVYLARERLGSQGLGLAALRTIGLGALVVLLLNPARREQRRDLPVTVLLDASLSMAAAGGQWRRALDTSRSLAGANGTILRFGERPAPFDTSPPVDGTSRLRAALDAARGRGGPVAIVTDGEIDDWATLPPTLLLGARVIVLPRETVPDAAILDAAVPRFVRAGDSVPVALTLGTWGGLGGATEVVITEGGRRVASAPVDLPAGSGTLRRNVMVPGALAEGERVLSVSLAVRGDAESRNDVRRRPITVSEQPAVVVVIDPADWEGRFLIRTLSDVARTSVRGFARVTAETWVDTERHIPVAAGTVRAAARGAAVLILRGGEQMAGAARRPVWHWPTDGQAVPGDWYVAAPAPPSPLAGRLGAVGWDSLPPLTAALAVAAPQGAWMALGARQGRRGLQRPVLLGSDSGGVRSLTTGASGLWRWALRGGASLDAYRTLIAGGLDWLLASEAGAGQAQLTATDVVPRGVPVTFRWQGGSVPDSVVVTLRSADTTVISSLRFDAAGAALVALPAGDYRWQARGVEARGMVVVEPYSDEFRPRAPAAMPAPEGAVGQTVTRYARGRWWLFALVVAALAGEWAWRQRRGLP